jgi:hypothetical protein
MPSAPKSGSAKEKKMRGIRVRQKKRVVTEEDLAREAEFQDYLEVNKYWSEQRMAFYDSLPQDERDYEKEYG